MTCECFEERASLPAILINGVKAKNVRFGLVTGREDTSRTAMACRQFLLLFSCLC
jgi:hypothetical protein